MVESRRWAIKKFLRGYAVTFTTAIVLILVLALLLFARIGALGSIRDISKINPLITSEQNQLVSIGDDGTVTIIGDDEQDGSRSSDKSVAKTEAGTAKNTDNNSSSSDNKPTANSGGGTGGGGGGTNNPGSGGNDSGSTNATQLVLSIGDMTCTKSGGIAGMVLPTYTVRAVISANVSGHTVSYQWTGAVNKPPGSATFDPGITQVEVTVSTQNLISLGSSVTLTVSPGSVSKTISQCT